MTPRDGLILIPHGLGSSFPGMAQSEKGQHVGETHGHVQELFSFLFIRGFLSCECFSAWVAKGYKEKYVGMYVYKYFYPCSVMAQLFTQLEVTA